MGNIVNLVYECDGYAFLYQLSPDTIKLLRTRRLLGAHQWSTKDTVHIFTPKQLTLVQENIYRMYKVPDCDLRIHLNVPIAQMDWNTPNQQEMSLFIYMEG